MGLLNKVLNFINNSSNQSLNEVNVEKAKFIKDFLMDNKQGMYSPISQNRRHINILKYVLSKELNTNNLKFKSLVVLANEKTILNEREAPAEIKNCIVKHDNVISKLEDIQKKEQVVLTLDEMNKIGQVLIKYNKSKSYNNIAKYSIVQEDFINSRDIKEFEITNNDESSIEDDENKLFENLRVYRNKKGREEGYKPISYHCVFSNAVIEQIIENMPDTIEELYNIKGLGKVKIGKYGEDIIDILKGKSKQDNSKYKMNLAKKAANEIAAVKVKDVSKTRELVTEDLKKYRLEKSRELKIKPYFIFNNAEMEQLLDRMPKNKLELLKVKGFGEKKVEEYGDEILEILNN